MKMKRLLMLALVLVLCVLAFTFSADASGNLNTAAPTKAEIQQKWQEVTSASTLFDEATSVSAPYAAGSLSDNLLESGITYLNYVRYVAKLPAVRLSDSLNEDAQYGAVVLAAIDELTHYPTQPSDMDDAFFQRGYSATTSSNISARYGYAPLVCLQSAVSGCMADNGDNNLAAVGHRRWLLNPTLLNVGFGYAEAASGWDYIVTKVFDRSGSAIDYDYISWPAAGNHPTNLFSPEDPWSITLNPNKYATPSLSKITITLTRQSDGRTWTFNSSTGSPQSSSIPYMTVDTNYYAIPNCIIFHPGSSTIGEYSGIYTVEVSGLTKTNGSAATLRYQVDFFDVEAGCLEHDYQASVKQPTCTAQGYTIHTCSNCGSSYKDAYTDARGHSYSSWAVTKAPTCTTAGSQKRSCARCSASETKSIAATGHNYVSGSCTACGASDGSVRLEAPVAKGANVASSGKIKITWNAVEGAIKYEVYRATSKNGTYSLKFTTTGTGYTNTGTTAGRYYYYYVRAIAADGTYADSNLVGRTCDLARPVVTIANVASSGKNQLKWDAVSSAVKYEIYRASSKHGTYTSIGTTEDTTYVDTASKAGVSYYYRVKAIASKTAANSALSTAKARMADLPRTTVSLSNRASDGKIVIKWNAVEGAVKYEVYRATSKNGTYTRIARTSSTSITNTSTAAGKTYYYKIRVIAENSAANSAYSAIKSRMCDLERPDVTITRSSGKPKLSWDKVDGAVSYKIYRATSKTGTYSLVKTTTGSSWKDTGAKSGKTYYYKVVAVCESSAGNSAASLIRYIKSK